MGRGDNTDSAGVATAGFRPGVKIDSPADNTPENREIVELVESRAAAHDHSEPEFGFDELAEELGFDPRDFDE